MKIKETYLETRRRIAPAAEIGELYALIERVAGKAYREAVDLELFADDGFDSYEISDRNGRILIRASSGSGIAVGFGSYLRERCPEAELFFQQVWAYQVGYYRPNKSPFRVEDSRAQEIMHRDLRALAVEGCEKHGLRRIPTGDAWALARADSRIGDRLCMEDNEHDGEWGQYLNGCVWLESLFGVSCIGNPFPVPFSRDTVNALQTAAHQAVHTGSSTGLPASDKASVCS